MDFHLDLADPCRDIVTHGIADTHMGSGALLGTVVGVAVGALVDGGRGALTGAVIGAGVGGVTGAFVPRRTPRIYAFSDLYVQLVTS